MAAATANCENLAIFLDSLESIQFSGLKSFTSAAILVSKAEASNNVIGPTPDLPSTSAFQNESTSLPTGLMTPKPVTATFFFIDLLRYQRITAEP
jgi:hypothetical protein